MSSTVFGHRNPFYGIRRFPDNGVIAGVCEGMALHFDWNPRVVRVIAVLLLFATGGWPMIVAYCLAWYIIEPLKGPTPSVTTVVPPMPPPAPSSPAAASPGPAASGAATVPMPELKARFARLDERLRGIEACVTDREFELRRELKKLES